MVQFFGHDSAAQRYARARPYFHDLVVEKLKGYIGLNERIGVALDVGCGTGLSSIALEIVAKQIIGIDASEQMLKCATSNRHITYLGAASPAHPFPIAARTGKSGELNACATMPRPHHEFPEGSTITHYIRASP